MSLSEKIAFYGNNLSIILLIISVILIFTLDPGPIVVSIAMICAWAGGYYGFHADFEGLFGTRMERLEEAVEIRKTKVSRSRSTEEILGKKPNPITDFVFAVFSFLLSIAIVVFALNDPELDTKSMRLFSFVGVAAALLSGTFAGMGTWNIHMTKRYERLVDKIFEKEDEKLKKEETDENSR